MSELFKKTILNNFKYSLEHKYILNINEINRILDDIDNCIKYYQKNKKKLFKELDNYEKINIDIKTILSTKHKRI